MAGSIRICLIAEGFTEDLVTCVDSITSHTKTLISIYANGKSNWISPDQFDSKQGEVDVLFGYYFALDRKFAIAAGGANPSAKYYRNADLELSLAIRAAGGKLLQIDLPLSQGRHHGYHDVDPDYRDKNSRKNYQRILDRFRGKNEILSPRR
ncbi:MAG: hypothetical protein EBW09_03025 [Actinobacteria bacterium]|nr:hypothetical protein [Actinomycetota bacterium]